MLPETIAEDVMEAILHNGLSYPAESIEWFGDTAIRVNFGPDEGSFIVTVEEE